MPKNTASLPVLRPLLPAAKGVKQRRDKIENAR